MGPFMRAIRMSVVAALCAITVGTSAYASPARVPGGRRNFTFGDMKNGEMTARYTFDKKDPVDIVRLYVEQTKPGQFAQANQKADWTRAKPLTKWNMTKFFAAAAVWEISKKLGVNPPGRVNRVVQSMPMSTLEYEEGGPTAIASYN